MSSVIVTKGLSKSFHGRPVVKRLDLDVPQGAVFALLGDNGAGKSTTMRMLTGLLPPDEGRATILGLDCWQAADRLRHRLGYVPERPRFYDWMTVAEIGWFAAGFHRAGYLKRYRGLTDRFGLDPAARLRALSKGGYAKVGLSLALAHEPEVLLLDEPTSGLDLFVRREFLGNIVDLAAAGRTILISSHAIAELERVASHVAFMAEGRLLLTGSLEDLRQRFVRFRLRFTSDPPVAGHLGKVLTEELAGKQWQAVVLDPDRAVWADIDRREGFAEVEESSLSLEEMYLALLARPRLAFGAEPSREVVA